MYIKKFFILILSTFLLLITASCSSNDGGGDSPTPTPPPVPEKVKVTVVFDAKQKLIWGTSKVQDRNFYLLTLFETLEKSFSVLESDPVFKQYLDTFKARLNAISNTSNPTAQQYAAALKFTPAEITDLSLHLKEVVNKSTDIQKLAIDYMSPSGVFQQFYEVTDADRFVQLAFVEAAEGINNIIDVYIAGKDPLYPELDKVSYDVNSAIYLNMLNTEIDALNQNQSNLKLFFQPFLKVALKALEINGRDEAGRYFPLEESVNKAAYEYIKTIDWSQYQYAFVLALGDSPNNPGDLPNISLGGMQSADRGVALYQEGKVPLIIFTGGFLRPFQTIYSEAIEMKKYVMNKYNIPENRILVDPQARHTTTNFRNVARLVFRYEIPHDKKAIVTGGVTQLVYVKSDEFKSRCLREMKHVPFELYNSVSDIYLEFTSKKEALHLDSSDPLDP